MTNDFLTFFLNPPLPGKTPARNTWRFREALKHMDARASVVFYTYASEKETQSVIRDLNNAVEQLAQWERANRGGRVHPEELVDQKKLVAKARRLKNRVIKFAKEEA